MQSSYTRPGWGRRVRRRCCLCVHTPRMDFCSVTSNRGHQVPEAMLNEELPLPALQGRQPGPVSRALHWGVGDQGSGPSSATDSLHAPSQ